ncbi:NACHT, LRR and PYD domains-containing protein 1b allele 2-like [Seriola dumerili]|uniref:NACHT, LRR and PYD domains-containing protein 1b allele 2-like n=1 Tax=Seriola dumerili TaxID=41447 RepID=UPI000BBE9BED|nr:NACHT, LRR and PYD domains-containing protein 1b allele 2-like [Seriola dumerili]
MNRVIKDSRDKTCDSDVTLDLNTAETMMDVSENDTKLMKPPSDFMPELQTESTQVSHRFRCPGPGGFRCTSTGLVFVMAQEAELFYRIVQWDEGLLNLAGKMAAGPLFEIQCPDDAVCQLHLPHCETKDALLSEGLLSVARCTDDGMSILEPLEITATHVIVKVLHLSRFGIVRPLKALRRFWNNLNPTSGQVLLFLRKPNPKTQKKNLNVLLFPSNIPLEEVRRKQTNSGYIPAPSKCELIEEQSYTVHCPTACIVQPEKAKFDRDVGPNYHSTFEIRLPTDTEQVTIAVRDETDTDVWKHDADLTATWTENVQEAKNLASVRTDFIDSVSEPLLHKLLDKLLECKVVTQDELEDAGTQKTRADKARVVINTVLRKGPKACAALIAALCEEDQCLSTKLKLMCIAHFSSILRNIILHTPVNKESVSPLSGLVYLDFEVMRV